MRQTLRYIRYALWLALIGGCIALLCGVRGCSKSKEEPLMDIGFKKEIEPTPIHIESIRQLQQWEFLSIDDEEIVDTTVSHWWKKDDQLVRIYRGCMRLGIDFTECDEQWAVALADTAIITLPGIKLLDPDFIDEARTRSFHEEGEWDANVYESLYKKAKRKMMAKGITKKNIKRAEENAVLQISNLFRTLGYPEVRITISPSSLHPSTRSARGREK